MNSTDLIGWDQLRHGGLLLDTPRLREIAEPTPEPLSFFQQQELRKHAGALMDGKADMGAFLTLVLEKICGFSKDTGKWRGGSRIGSEWTRRAVTGEGVRPRRLWQGFEGGSLPVFFDTEKRIGLGRGRKSVSQTLQWLRAGHERLALVTNGRQWRLLFAGMDFDAWCEWDVDLWFEEGTMSTQVTALRTLLCPRLWTPTAPGTPSPLVQAILDTRKGQAELSAVLGERVREAVEVLLQGHGEILKEECEDIPSSVIYRAAVRVIMRLVIILFAESRDLLPRDNAIYHTAYGLNGLLEELGKAAVRGGSRMARSWSAWPRILALFRLIYKGSHHEALPVPVYGGELFAPGSQDSGDTLEKVLYCLESACFEREVMSDRDVLSVLDFITRTRVRVRQGRSSTLVPAPVDFSDLSSEYIGILYEGLLDFELKTAASGDPVVFLSVGNQPALPLSKLEAMDDEAIQNLIEKMKDTRQTEETESEGPVEETVDEELDAEVEEGEEGDGLNKQSEAEMVDEDAEGCSDERHTTRTRAETWARRAVAVGKLVKKPKGTMTPEKSLAYEEEISRKARRLVTRVMLPGELYLVRWGGTRKGAGAFYTRPGLAVPTVHRTLRPLAYDPPVGEDGKPELHAPLAAWTPKPPETILALKICDPAGGSGTFSVAVLRFLTDALYASLHHYQRIHQDGEKALIRLLSGPPQSEEGVEEVLGQELLPCRPEDPHFEQRLKAVLRRHIVERCIYAVDLDPLAVELCRLSLWIETMDRELPFSFLDHKVKCGNSLVGAWFDQFQHYPVMAWKNREGGDKNHTNGVHFKKEARTKAIKSFVKDTLTPDLRRFLKGRTLFEEDLQEKASRVHEDALKTLSRLHALPVHDSDERGRIYREELMGSEAYLSLKAAMDLWCACWFWPADKLDHAPIPSTLANPSEETLAIARQVAEQIHFFHWELEFPDVFRTAGSGFDALVGNPPWDIAKPNSKEFFSNIDPLYRSYGKQEALRTQSGYFEDEQIEREWLDYSANFRAQSNFTAHAASPFGDPAENEKSPDRFSIWRGKKNETAHDRWRNARMKSQGFADPSHTFRHQGSADINLYKLFLEQAYTLLREDGRMGVIVPSGLYSDHGTVSLRHLFLDHCRWEWLFGFENREGIFEIHRSYKFNPVIVAKGDRTEKIQTAFMRRRLEDWERAEGFVTPYTREQVERFSPRSRAILEIQSPRDLDILEKIYANAVLLGDDGPDGWGIRYVTEFHMSNDSKLFPPRPKWEAQGYRPDEYSRWIKGNWRPIAELWSELGVDADHPTPLSPKIQKALNNADVIVVNHPLRCAQPPYNKVPVPRAKIPAGTTLSRELDSFIKEDMIEGIALPLYQGLMIWNLDFSFNKWIRGRGRSALWEEIPWSNKTIEPQFLVNQLDYLRREKTVKHEKICLRRITTAVHQRTAVVGIVPNMPCGDVASVIQPNESSDMLKLAAGLNSFAIDYVAKKICTYLHLDWHVVESLPAPRLSNTQSEIALFLNCASPIFSPLFLKFFQRNLKGASSWAISPHERLRMTVMLQATVISALEISLTDINQILTDCDLPTERLNKAQVKKLDPKGFWRVDKDKEPELRQTVLTIIAFHDLEEKIRECGGNKEEGIEVFLNQNNGQGWMLPETVRLADYGLGHDDRAKDHQPVASRLGPRFYDWQLAQTHEESWRECHVHARNLLGLDGYVNLLADVLCDSPSGTWHDALAFACDLSTKEVLLDMFAAALSRIPPDTWEPRVHEARTIMTHRGLSLDPPDMTELLANAVKRIPEEDRPPALSTIKDLVGDAAAAQILADLDEKKSGKVSERSAPYKTSTKKMTQMGLFD